MISNDKQKKYQNSIVKIREINSIYIHQSFIILFSLEYNLISYFYLRIPWQIRKCMQRTSKVHEFNGTFEFFINGSKYKIQ